MKDHGLRSQRKASSACHWLFLAEWTFLTLFFSLIDLENHHHNNKTSSLRSLYWWKKLVYVNRLTPWTAPWTVITNFLLWFWKPLAVYMGGRATLQFLWTIVSVCKTMPMLMRRLLHLSPTLLPSLHPIHPVSYPASPSVALCLTCRSLCLVCKVICSADGPSSSFAFCFLG
jgi:hypothetical protein